MLMILWSALLFIVAVGVLIAFHEFGHFWVARRLGVKVLRFSIGFGKPLLKFYDKQKTEYVVAAIPLGGYVKMVDEAEGPVAEEDKPHSFNRQSLWTRFAIVVAGPLFNLIFAFLAFWLMFVIGIHEAIPVIGDIKPNSIASLTNLQKNHEIIAVNGQKTQTWHDISLAIVSQLGEKGKLIITTQDPQSLQKTDHTLALKDWAVDIEKEHPLLSLGITPYSPPIPAIVASVLAKGPAAKAGIKESDQILAMDSKPVASWQALVQQVQVAVSPTVVLTVLRAGNTLTIPVTAESKQVRGDAVRYLGIVSTAVKLDPRHMRTINYNVFTAITPAIQKTWYSIKMTIGLMVKLIMGKLSLDLLSGPIGIAQGAGISASLGFSYFLSFLALISVSLGILNLLPIPVLDGGHLLFYAIEAVRGRPLSLSTQAKMIRVGLLLLLMIMTVAIFNDIQRLIPS